MQTAGIIAEYNPFHLGHAWHMAETRRLLGGRAAVVCVMSGHWVQRGECALADKWSRASAALMGGAAWAVYGLLSRVLASVPEGATEAVLSWRGNAAATLVAIAVAVAVYGAMVVALRALSREDLSLMPKGDKIARLLRL